MLGSRASDPVDNEDTIIRDVKNTDDLDVQIECSNRHDDLDLQPSRLR